MSFAGRLGQMGREYGLLGAILVAAGGIRVWGPRAEVFTPDGVSLLEPDGWYHLRLIESQVRNFPFRVTHDPYASPDGMFVPIAPLFDTVIATAAVVTGGTAASADHIARVAAIVPPIAGVLAVALVFLLGRLAFGRRAGLLAAALTAILPGHFLDRTLLGYVDHHALEVLLALAVLLAFGREALRAADGTGAPWRTTARRALWPGSALGLYLLAWGSGAFLVAALAVWLVVHALLDDHRRHDDGGLVRVAGGASLVACAWVIAFQHPDMHRYGSQLIATMGLAGLCLAIDRVRVVTRGRGGAWPLIAVGGVLAAASAIALALMAPRLFDALLIDAGRFVPAPERMGVLEARPLFLFSGEWSAWQPWRFFRTGFYVGAPALVLLLIASIRRRRPAGLLVAVWGLLMLAATIGQNRFGYYLVPALALGAGWLGAWVLDWGGVPEQGRPEVTRRASMPFARELSVVAVAGIAFGPNLVPALNTTVRGTPLTAPWREATTWLREATPEPFGDAGYYVARYDRDPRVADYTVMAWWDYGYWLLQQGRRVPVANPTQSGAAVAARFFSALDEREALALLDRVRARYVVVDFEVPYSIGASGFRGKYHALAPWAGVDEARDYAMYFEPDGAGGVRAVPLFHETYYRSMTFRLYAAGGAAMAPSRATVVRWQTQPTPVAGVTARMLLEARDFEEVGQARRYLAALGPGASALVGRDPLRSPVPVEALAGLARVWDSPQRYSDLHGLPAIRIFARGR